MSAPPQDLSPLTIFALIAIVALLLTCAIGLVVGTLAQRAENRRPCPECGELKLRFVEGISATILVHGQRAGDAWSLHECSACGARLKDHRGTWEPPSDSDLRHFLPKNSTTP